MNHPSLFPSRPLEARPPSRSPAAHPLFLTLTHDDDGDDGDESEQTSVASRGAIMAALAQRAAASPYLLAMTGASTAGRMFNVTTDMIIGRASGNGMRLDEEGISRRHARIRFCQDGRVAIADLSSTNGTFVNGVQIIERVLEDGDQIQIGTSVILKFTYRDALDASVQRGLYESATRDALTGAHNKKVFLQALESEVEHARRQQKELALVMFDIDHFKRINDQHGHPAGDHVLQTLGSRARERIREGDLFARYGGEEFALLLKGADARLALSAAERLRALVESTSFVYSGVRLPVTISLGVASFDARRPESGTELLARSDKYLYRAKRSGRNRVDGFSVSGAL